jgi:hypothetical protein
MSCYSLLTNNSLTVPGTGDAERKETWSLSSCDSQSAEGDQEQQVTRPVNRQWTEGTGGGNACILGRAD